jgi:uncharacterized membrane protein
LHARVLRKQAGYFLLGALAIGVGIYPFQFANMSIDEGILSGKPAYLLQSWGYLISFYLHIFSGGIALLAGFSQFLPKLRYRRPGLHRGLGKCYVLAVLFSGLAGLYIAMFAYGGLVSALGFGTLALAWLYSTIRAYSAIRGKNILTHRQWMTRSYALCFAAVTLRIYLPLSTALMGFEFLIAYQIISWLCWIPNLLVAELIIMNSARVAKKDSFRT